MICNVCGSEFSIDIFDMCPYCMTPFVNKEDNDVIEEKGEEVEELLNIDDIDIEAITKEIENVVSSEFVFDFDENEFEISDADLFEEREEQEEDISIDELGLSVRAINAFRRARINTLSELMLFLTTNSVSQIKNAGAKTIEETERLMERIRAGELDVIRNKNNESEDIIPGPLFQNMSADVDYLSIVALAELGLSQKAVSHFVKNGVRCCGELKFLTSFELKDIVGGSIYVKLPATAKLLEKDIISLLNYVLDELRNNRECDVFIRRAKCETLQEIADNPSGEYEVAITRERVRQLERSYANSVIPFVKELLFILKGGNNFISVQDLLEIFDDDDYDQILLYACKLIEEFEYLDFADAFVERQSGNSIERKILSIMSDIIGNGIDLSESRDIIDDVLLENKLDFVGLEGIVNLLRKHNYHLYGRFVSKGKANYATICMHIIKNDFQDGIKLSQSESGQSDDLKKLRKIVAEKYTGLSVPTSDRALSSSLVRSGLILRGRGQYISEEYVVIDEEILTNVIEYIDNMGADRVFYNEIYAEFEGALNVLCGIDNSNYLHGILSLRFPNQYEYRKDYLLKNGLSDNQADSIADRIYNYICSMGRPISKLELAQEFRGFSNVMLIIPFTNDKRLLQWEYNYFSCTGILDITPEDENHIQAILNKLFEENKGYTSDGLLFKEMQVYYPEFLQINGIQNEMNLHYIVASLFSDKIDFRRPHIGRKGEIDLSLTKNVALYLLGYPETFDFEHYMEIVDDMAWSRVTASAVLTDIEEDYARASLNKYVKEVAFVVPNNIVNELRTIIEIKMENGFLSLINMEFDEFPDWNYSWNEFIIESIVKNYMPEYEVIQPTMKDRRYQRGIIVRKDTALITYPQIVATKMKLSGYEKMTESQFLSFLVVHNLARKFIPNELANSDYVKKDGDFYSIMSI
jgi:hypothetical protein